MHERGYCQLVQRSYSIQSVRQSVFRAVVDNVIRDLFFSATGACRGIAKTPPRQKHIENSARHIDKQ